MEDTQIRKRAAAAAKAIDSAGSESAVGKPPVASEGGCPSWLVPAVGLVAFCMLFG